MMLRRTGSVICPSCGKLVGVNDERCLSCGRLRPGMFAEVAVVLPGRNEVIAIPATSVLYAPYGDSVFVVEDNKTGHTEKPVKVVRQQFARLGEKTNHASSRHLHLHLHLRCAPAQVQVWRIRDSLIR